MLAVIVKPQSLSDEPGSKSLSNVELRSMPYLRVPLVSLLDAALAAEPLTATATPGTRKAAAAAPAMAALARALRPRRRAPGGLCFLGGRRCCETSDRLMWFPSCSPLASARSSATQAPVARTRRTAPMSRRRSAVDPAEFGLLYRSEDRGGNDRLPCHTVGLPPLGARGQARRRSGSKGAPEAQLVSARALRIDRAARVNVGPYPVLVGNVDESQTTTFSTSWSRP